MRWFLPSSSEIERALKSTTTREVGGLNNHKKTPPQPQCLKIAQKCLIFYFRAENPKNQIAN